MPFQWHLRVRRQQFVHQWAALRRRLVRVRPGDVSGLLFERDEVSVWNFEAELRTRRWRLRQVYGLQLQQWHLHLTGELRRQRAGMVSRSSRCGNPSPE